MLDCHEERRGNDGYDAMNYHLFRLICGFKLVLRLVTLQKAAVKREKM